MSHSGWRPRTVWLGFSALAFGPLPASAGAQAPDLALAREALAAGDTSAAVRALEHAAAERPFGANGLGALFLLDWIGRGPAHADRTASLEAPDQAIRIVVRAWSDLQGSRSDGRTSQRPGQTAADLDSLAATLEHQAPSVSAAVRWVQVRRLLRNLSRAAADVAPTEGPLPVCPGGCNTPAVPPQADQLITRLSVELNASGLRNLVTLFRELEQGPEPFNTLSARAHVAVCALLHGAPPAGCWPRTDRLVGRDSAEVAAMTHVFRGHHGLASRLMEANPSWFVPLDAQRELLDTPDSVAETDASTTRHPMAATRMVAVPGSGVALGLPVDAFWRLAWPLYLQPYNERLTVHRGRLLLADVVRRLSTADTPLFGAVGDPVLIVRTGVPLAVVPLIGPGSRARQPGARSTRVYVPLETHETTPGESLALPWAPIDLALAVVQPPRYRWTTGFVSEDYQVLGLVDHQLVHYVRDGSRYVDVHTAWTRPLRCTSPRPLLGLIQLDSALRERKRDIRIDLVEHAHARFSTMLDPGTYLYSLELLDRGCRVAQRTRYWIEVPPAEDAFMSDLMLADELFPSDTHQVAERVGGKPPARISATLLVSPGGTVRFYWEVYGVQASTEEPGRLAVRFEVVDTRRRRVAVTELGVVADRARRTRGTVAVAYPVSVPRGEGPLGCGIAVGLPPGTRGLYVARVTVTDRRTRRTATAERAFYVRP